MENEIVEEKKGLRKMIMGGALMVLANPAKKASASLGTEGSIYFFLFIIVTAAFLPPNIAINRNMKVNMPIIAMIYTTTPAS